MLFLPEDSDYVKPEWEKISSYIQLSKAGCPVLKSALLLPNDTIDDATVYKLKKYFRTEDTTIRYQYIKPNCKPIVTGNRYRISEDVLKNLSSKDALIWMLEPLDRQECTYGIMILFREDSFVIEIVGRGFDASDLTRGRCSPHEIIVSELPVRSVNNSQWWKYIDVSIHADVYQKSKSRRMEQLRMMGYTDLENIFDNHYMPIPFGYLEKLLYYIDRIDSYLQYGKEYCVACAIYDGKYIFWDVQSPHTKMVRYGIKA